MELHQLRYLSAVAHCGSAAKAAEELYVSKQAVSKAIRSLEHETGFELFDRDDGMRLTENGREILVHAEAVLRELDEIDLYVQAQGAGARQTESLAIAFKSFPLDYLFSTRVTKRWRSSTSSSTARLGAPSPRSRCPIPPS